METVFPMKGHQWLEHEVEIAGENYFYRQCRLCRHVFVRLAYEEKWRAAVVGVSRFMLLDEITDALWSSEECSGIRTAKLMNDFLAASPKNRNVKAAG
jgi:hypothetical protein